MHSEIKSAPQTHVNMVITSGILPTSKQIKEHDDARAMSQLSE